MLLLQRDWHMYSNEQLELAANNKRDMLELAYSCYSKAATIEEGEEGEEQWLHHYMLGKIREKQRQNPRIYLDHYKMAAQYLYEDKAKYPRKITFYHTAPHLAIEALEVWLLFMIILAYFYKSQLLELSLAVITSIDCHSCICSEFFSDENEKALDVTDGCVIDITIIIWMHYRLHVSIIKYLLSHDDEDNLPLDMLEGYVKDAACGPFATCQELTSTDITYSDDGSHSNTSMMPIISDGKRRRRVHQTIPDHNYSKEKHTSESELSSHGSDLHNSSQDSMYIGDLSADCKPATLGERSASNVSARPVGQSPDHTVMAQVF
ncbi:hypothetical protein LSH36_785g00046 [Paralvinella palmiformis]|uniref:Uncharacterized protein n=1 Tax=Paralvinella palmiformis TaxID=53620 RepID=A0AAD9J1U8_9ANNE|nr:hypothetical protein LSH36_785g00046 [Paralvinella palmiformis]